MKKAALDISPGILIFAGEDNKEGFILHFNPFVFMSAPNSFNILSLWSRVLTISVSSVSPSA